MARCCIAVNSRVRTISPPVIPAQAGIQAFTRGSAEKDSCTATQVLTCRATGGARLLQFLHQQFGVGIAAFGQPLNAPG